MKFFSIFKKDKPQAALSPAALIKLTQDFIPEFYKDNQNYIDSKNYLESKKYDHSLKSLIKLATESGHYFSESFWLDLEFCSDKLNMPLEAKNCQLQIERNKQEVGFKTSKGWTTVKIDSEHFQHHIAKIVKNEWLEERRTKDKFYELIKENGFHLKSHGHSGLIYFVDNNKVLEIGFELSTIPKFDILISFDNIEQWSFPDELPISMVELANIKQRLLYWLETEKIKSDLV